MSHAVLRRPGEQGGDHAAGELLSASFRRYGDLPHEKGLGLGGRAVARYPADDAASLFGDDAMVGEMVALEEVAIAAVAIERRAGGDQRRYGRPVGCKRLAKLHIVRRGCGRCGWRFIPIFPWRQ